MNTPQQKRIGALWERQDRNGNTMMSGEIEVGGKTYMIVAFHNDRKNEARHPDWFIYPSTMKPKQGSPRETYNRRQQEKQEPPADDFPGPDDDPGPDDTGFPNGNEPF